MTKKISVEELQEQYKQKLFDWCNEENNCCMESILTDGEEHSDTECFHGTKKCPCFECKRTKGLIDVMVDNICEMIYEVKSLDLRLFMAQIDIFY